ncbi:MAG: hypothetical protein GX660_22745, partial [Clostridiaceae bacterium]|nr:hypothetical protein [Clostridiaceae bacterium]
IAMSVNPGSKIREGINAKIEKSVEDIDPAEPDYKNQYGFCRIAVRPKNCNDILECGAEPEYETEEALYKQTVSYGSNTLDIVNLLANQPSAEGGFLPMTFVNIKPGTSNKKIEPIICKEDEDEFYIKLVDPATQVEIPLPVDMLWGIDATKFLQNSKRFTDFASFKNEVNNLKDTNAYDYHVKDVYFNNLCGQSCYPTEKAHSDVTAGPFVSGVYFDEIIEAHEMTHKDDFIDKLEDNIDSMFVEKIEKLNDSLTCEKLSDEEYITKLKNEVIKIMDQLIDKSIYDYCEYTGVAYDSKYYGNLAADSLINLAREKRINQGDRVRNKVRDYITKLRLPYFNTRKQKWEYETIDRCPTCRP